MADVIEIEPKCDDFLMDDVRYSIPRPMLCHVIRKWNDRRRMRHAMKVLKRLFKGNVPHIEDAHTLELIECVDGTYLRIVKPPNAD